MSPDLGESRRVSRIRRLGLVTAAATMVLGVGFVPPASAQDSPTVEPTTGELAALGSPTRELTTGEVEDDTIYVVEEYRIDGDKIAPNGATEIPAQHQKVWNRFAALFPAATRPEIDLFVAIDTTLSPGRADGVLQTSALDPSKRYLALDVSGEVEFKELTRTMTHEFGHLLQFRPSALVPGTMDAPCDVYDGGEACPKAGSYLRLWDQKFYPGVKDNDYPQEPADVAARYTPDKYVTDNYSATNPAEDMAETWAEWLLLDAPTGPSFVNRDPHYKFPVTGNRVVDQKLRFFDQFPELVAMRAHIRSVLGLDQLVLEAPPTSTTNPPSSNDNAPSSKDNAPSDDDAPKVTVAAAKPLVPAFTG
ncbi:MAG: hypothetical protein R2754_03935 [Microthrixaceae bacterium]